MIIVYLVMKLNSNIGKGINYFENGNYKKALKCFNAVGSEDRDYDYAVLYRIYCLIELKEYKKALKIINPSIEKAPYSELLWFSKISCHLFLNEDDKAFMALDEVERIMDRSDKFKLVYVAKMYNLLNDFDRALKYCNEALAIDGNFKDALHEKSLIGIGMGDDEMINEVADKLLLNCEDDFISILPVFLLKLFSKNYRQAFNLVESTSKENVSRDTVDLFKSIVFKRICDDLTINILTVNNGQLSIDECLCVLFDFIECNIDSGRIGDVQYFIV